MISAILQRFVGPSLWVSVSIVRAALASNIVAEQDTIGPADGTSYEVISQTELEQSAPQCGFNDLGVPILGTFSREVRRYRRYNSGTLESEWQETTDAFKECNSP